MKTVLCAGAGIGPSENMPDSNRIRSLLRFAWLLAVGAFLLMLFAVPLFGLMHAASSALLGLTILLFFTAVQYPIFLLIRRWLPTVDRDGAKRSE